jgi:CRISPR-associated protein Cas2
MWTVVMFDLPVDTKKARRNATRFRKLLKRRGFMMLQYSVYARCFMSADASAAERARLRPHVPDGGQVRFMTVTDRQFSKMEVFHGAVRREPEPPPAQVLLF